MSKRLLSLILAALLVMPAVVSCSDSTTDETTPKETENVQAASQPDESVSEETEIEITDDLPEIKYDGYQYMIYNANVLENDWFITNYVNFDEDSADVLESAVYRRNSLVEERFDINFQESIIEVDEIKTAVIAADGTFDLCLIKGADSLSLAQDGYLYDQLKLNYIDLEKPYYDQNAVRELTIAGKLYHTAGDFITTKNDSVKVFFFNKGLIENYNLTNPYDYVNEGNWTFDTFGQLISGVSDDLNGDGVYNDQDRYGLLSWSGAMFPSLIMGAGEKYTAKDADDKPSLSFYNDRFIQVYEAIANMCYANGGTVTYNANSQNTMGLSSNHRVQEIMFPNNQALFWNENISWSKALREMEMDFGILPAPKFDTDQESYHNYIGAGFFGPNIPVCVKDVDRTCIVLEALNSMSTGVNEAYYDVMLKSKLSRDEESSGMLDIIFANLVYDLSVQLALADVNQDIYDMLGANNMDVASFYNKNQKVMNRLIENAYNKISALDH